MSHDKPKRKDVEQSIMSLLADCIADDPAWAARFMTTQSNDLREARVEIVKLKSQVEVLHQRVPGMFFNPATQEWEEGEERDMAYDAPEHPDSKKLSDADERILRKPKVRIGPDDVT
jgi:hypothetical protein